MAEPASRAVGDFPPDSGITRRSPGSCLQAGCGGASRIFREPFQPRRRLYDRISVGSPRPGCPFSKKSHDFDTAESRRAKRDGRVRRSIGEYPVLSIACDTRPYLFPTNTESPVSYDIGLFVGSVAEWCGLAENQETRIRAPPDPLRERCSRRATTMARSSIGPSPFGPTDARSSVARGPLIRARPRVRPAGVSDRPTVRFGLHPVKMTPSEPSPSSDGL